MSSFGESDREAEARGEDNLGRDLSARKIPPRDAPEDRVPENPEDRVPGVVEDGSPA